MPILLDKDKQKEVKAILVDMMEANPALKGHERECLEYMVREQREARGRGGGVEPLEDEVLALMIKEFASVCGLGDVNTSPRVPRIRSSQGSRANLVALTDAQAMGSIAPISLLDLENMATSERSRYEDEIIFLRLDPSGLMDELFRDLNANAGTLIFLQTAISGDPTPTAITTLSKLMDRVFKAHVYRVYHFASVWFHVQKCLKELRSLGFTDRTAASDLVKNIKIRTIWFEMRKFIFHELVKDLATEIKQTLAASPHFAKYFDIDKGKGNPHAWEPQVALIKPVNPLDATVDGALRYLVDPESFWDAPVRIRRIEKALKENTPEGKPIDARLSSLLTEYATLLCFMDISGRPLLSEETKVFFSKGAIYDPKLRWTAPAAWDEGETYGGKPLMSTPFAKCFFPPLLETLEKEGAMKTLWELVDQSYVRHSQKSITEYFEMPPIEIAPKWSSGSKGADSFHKSNIPAPTIFEVSDYQTQSVHSYIQESGLTQKEKIKTRPISQHPGSSTQQTEDEGSSAKIVQQPVFYLPRTIVKTFHRLMKMDAGTSESKGQLRWSEFTKAMRRVGFSIEEGQGSAVNFRPPSPDDRPISIHKPHPEAILSPIAIRRIGWRLRRAYGWNADWFNVTGTTSI